MIESQKEKRNEINCKNMVDTLKPRCYTLNIAKALQNKTVAPQTVDKAPSCEGAFLVS